MKTDSGYWRRTHSIFPDDHKRSTPVRDVTGDERARIQEIKARIDQLQEARDLMIAQAEVWEA